MRNFILITLLLALGAGAAELKLPRIFTNHLVLQRERAIPVWGWGEPGAKVSVTFADQSVDATVGEDGRWRLELAPLAASSASRAMTVTSGEATLTVADILVGEVWLCSGQSNMQWTVQQCANAEAEIKAGDHPRLRMISVARIMAPTAQPDVTGAWEVATPETVGNFSAVAYYFGRNLREELDVPIGLVNISWGGTRIEPWTTRAGFDAIPELADISRELELRDPSSAAHKEKLTAYLTTLDAWTAKTRDGMATDASTVPAPPFPPELAPISSHQQPTALYNGMVHGLGDYPVRGAIWYQGESNYKEGSLYTQKMFALIEGWRRIWGQDLPFYFVQIAPYRYGNDDPWLLPEFWEAQTATLTMPRTGMVVINDIGNPGNIHPMNKQDVGRRLALLALAHDYGRDVVWSGPTFKELKPAGKELRVVFDHVGSGLITRDGKPPTHFEIIGPQSEWTAAAAVIEGTDTIVLTAEGVAQPVAMRFAWDKIAEPNLMNKEGLPAGAFRAGTVPQHDYLAMYAPEFADWQVVYDLDLKQLGPAPQYAVDNHEGVGAFDRVAYFLELRPGSGPVQWVLVAMDPFTDDAGKLGVPTAVTFQQPLANLSVRSNVKGVVTGDGLTGNIEFWPSNYSAVNSAEVPNASTSAYDFGDQPTGAPNGYGSMQIHNPAARQTLFAVNAWSRAPASDIGIGNWAGRSLDWTFAGNAGTWTHKRLRILVHPAR